MQNPCSQLSPVLPLHPLIILCHLHHLSMCSIPKFNTIIILNKSLYFKSIKNKKNKICFTLINSCFDALPYFMYTRVSKLYHFSSIWRTSFNIFHQGSPLAINSLSFCLSEKLIILHFRKSIYWILNSMIVFFVFFLSVILIFYFTLLLSWFLARSPLKVLFIFSK